MEGKSPLDVAEIKQKIENGQVKVKAKRTRKNANKNTNRDNRVKGVNGTISDAKIIAWIKEQASEFTSTQIRDALQFMSRTQARRVLKRLVKTGVVKIKISQLTEKRRTYVHTAA